MLLVWTNFALPSFRTRLAEWDWKEPYVTTITRSGNCCTSSTLWCEENKFCSHHYAFLLRLCCGILWSKKMGSLKVVWRVSLLDPIHHWSWSLHWQSMMVVVVIWPRTVRQSSHLLLKRKVFCVVVQLARNHRKEIVLVLQQERYKYQNKHWLYNVLQHST